jgi:hypothetical protein
MKYQLKPTKELLTFMTKSHDDLVNLLNELNDIEKEKVILRKDMVHILHSACMTMSLGTSHVKLSHEFITKYMNGENVEYV